MTPPLLAHPAPTFGGPEPSTPVEELGETIAAMAARIHAATYELLVLLRQFDAQLGWNNGFLSCADWLHWRTGIDVGAAREKVRVARALEVLPQLSGAMQRGEISYAKVRALTRIATPENEPRLLELAYAGTASHIERVVRAWRRCDRIEEARETERRHLSRSVTTYVDDDGMVIVRARLTPEQGAVVQRALDAATERMYQESKAAAVPESITEEVTFAQRRADALALLAECALAADLDRGTAGDRYQVVLHVEAGTEAEAPAQAVLELDEGGVRVSAETSRRLSCDGSVVVMSEAPDGTVLDVGRKTRLVPAPIRRALAARDSRCRFPGCCARRCDAHHITHWANGGATSLDNLMLLCRRHHTLLHEGGLTVERDRFGTFRFMRPDGRVLEASPPLPPPAAGVIVTMGSARTLPCWDGTPFRLADVFDAVRGQARS
jgi:hypothetical protein